MVAELYNPSVVRLRPELPGETLLVGGREEKCPVSCVLKQIPLELSGGQREVVI